MTSPADPMTSRARPGRRLAEAVAAMLGTIRGRIVIAFLVMSAITGALGLSAASSIRRADELVSQTFDRSLMSINYARAAATDFAGMRTAEARRWMVTDPAARTRLDERFASLQRLLAEDLEIAVERAQSERATRAAQAAERAVSAWTEARARITDFGRSEAAYAELDRHAAVAEENFDLFINYTAGDGFIYRQQARAIVARETRLNLLGTLIAVLLSGTVAFCLARRIMGPLADASQVATRIAGGDLSGTMPAGGADEVGTLLSAMGTMRDNIRRAMEKEVAQRISAEDRLADALETSREGIVVVDEAGRISLTNSQAEDYLGFAAGTRPAGRTIAALAAGEAGPGSLAQALLATTDERSELRLGDGRWLRISRSATRTGGFIAVCSDITLLKEQEAILQATNLRLDTALDNMSQGLCLFDADGRLTVVNRRYCEIFSLEPGQLPLGLPYRDVAGLSAARGDYPQPEPDAFALAQAETASGGAVDSDFLHLGDGRVVAVSHKAVRGGGLVATYEDVTERREADARIAFMARHDVLTGLPNRAMFGERIEEAVAHLGRGSPFAVLCLDLDRFKEVNDTLGHPVGDALLRAVADRLRACVREVDTVARLGGDEFAIILSQAEQPRDAAVLARRIVEVVSAPYDLDGHRASVGVSIGICFAPGDGTTCDKLLKNADVALYRAKADGRGTWRFFEAEMDVSLQARRALELDLREALAREEFELHYQPIYDFRARRIGGFEALVRWRHPVRGLVPPGDFISVAEEIGLIVPLGAWCLTTACTEAMRWPDGIKVAVNVSAVQFRDEVIVEAVRQALAQSRLPPGRLELEITESVLLKDNLATLATLYALRRLGVRIAMDDFGTGYSSLSYLRSFPFDKIKIDQSFVRDITNKTDSGLIVRAVIGLGLSLGMRTTAEGIETEAQFDRLRSEGCDEGQGYFFAKPSPASEVPRAIERWSRGNSDAARAVA
ncbi:MULTISPECIES: EAL domain-containing protein [unclassified Methylobacterium]|uniref:EAL domain-containing protein n=1 Tax=unclassified Methylobacterium TaxID=2615210 RepID=UPI0006FE36BD|nr:MULTISPECIES: EAL domain-containing protein [unclassified Methylobacterium]KQO64073.1 deubiquitinase [Methylobacterium sp. Leaf88]KQO68011.1 deubiquitinase [Methylobacterium sp. Leaf89]